jgi:hypothetical protein
MKELMTDDEPCVQGMEDGPCLVHNSSPNFTMQKGDFPSHQNVGKYMEY